MKNCLLGKMFVLFVLVAGLLSCWNAFDSGDSSDGTFKVTYDGNGSTSGTVPTDSYGYDKGEKVTVKAGSLARTGYSFEGWNTASDGSGTTYTAGQTFTMGSANVTLYARWIASGSGIWAKSVAVASGSSNFNAVAKDSSGNIYTVGYLYGNGTFTFGSVNVSGTYNSGFNAYILKSDSSGTPLWVRSVSAGSSGSYFTGVTTDSSGNAYAVGYISLDGIYTFGSKSVSGPCSLGTNPRNGVIVKYDPSGTVLWAKTVDSATGGDGYSASSFQDVNIDSSGKVYVAGWIYGTRTYTFGSETVTGG